MTCLNSIQTLLMKRKTTYTKFTLDQPFNGAWSVKISFFTQLLESKLLKSSADQLLAKGWLH